VTEGTQSSTSELHRLWARLENEHHELAEMMRQLGVADVDVSLLRERQAKLLLEINAVVAEIRAAPASTLQDYLALLDVAIEHEIDLVPDIACYGATDFPMITRLLRALAKTAPGFEFNSLRRWLSPLGEFEQLMGDEKPYEPPAKEIEVRAPSV
jgi:hypothetical protein